MEIKGVEKEKVEYPKINEISDKKLKKAIPNEWMKIGITSFLFDILMQNKVFAISMISVENFLHIEGQIAGGVPGRVEHIINQTYVTGKKVCGTIAVVSIVMLIITSIKILRKKLTRRWSNIKMNNKLKVVFIVSIICFTISIIGFAIFSYLLV